MEDAVSTTITFKVEYDDGAGPKVKNQPDPFVTRRQRDRGFYLRRLDDGELVRELPVPIGYMRVSEMEPLAALLTEINRSDMSWISTLKQKKQSKKGSSSRLRENFKNILKRWHRGSSSES